MDRLVELLGKLMKTCVLALAAIVCVAGAASAQNMSIAQIIPIVMRGEPVKLNGDQRHIIGGLAQGLLDSCNFGLSDDNKDNISTFIEDLDMPLMPFNGKALKRRALFEGAVAFADGRDCSDPTTRQLAEGLAVFMGLNQKP